MEKNQQNTATPPNKGHEQQAGGRPGQELPSDAPQHEDSSSEQNQEQHSESSLPQENETLGTP